MPVLKKRVKAMLWRIIAYKVDAAGQLRTACPFKERSCFVDKPAKVCSLTCRTCARYGGMYGIGKIKCKTIKRTKGYDYYED